MTETGAVYLRSGRAGLTVHLAGCSAAGKRAREFKWAANLTEASLRARLASYPWLRCCQRCLPDRPVRFRATVTLNWDSEDTCLQGRTVSNAGLVPCGGVYLPRHASGVMRVAAENGGASGTWTFELTPFHPFYSLTELGDWARQCVSCLSSGRPDFELFIDVEALTREVQAFFASELPTRPAPLWPAT